MKFAIKFFFFIMIMNCDLYAQYYGWGYGTPFFFRGSNNYYYNVRDTISYPYTPHYYSDLGINSAKFDFRIVMLNDSVIYTRSAIDFSGTVHFVVAMDGKRKLWIKPYETKEISRAMSGGKRLRGIPADSCWLFKTETGKINVYSFLAEPGTDRIIAIQKGQGGEIVPLTRYNLSEMVSNDDEVMKLAEKGKLWRAISKYNRRN